MGETLTTKNKLETTRKYRLTGEVQGVGFRRFLQYAAAEAGVRGWARNEADGSLVVLLRGGGKKLTALRPLLQRGPPAAAVVTLIELVAEDGDEAPDSFEIR